jgi:hypothetical protein
VIPRDSQAPDYFAVLTPFAALALLIWWMVN